MDQVRMTRITSLLILLAVLIVYTYLLRYRDVESPLMPDLAGIPTAIGDYESTDAHQPAEALQLLGADRTVFRTYRSADGYTIWLFLGYFGTQQENSQIHSPKHCYPGAGWDIVEEGTLRLDLAGTETAVKRLLISDGGQQREVIYWFDTPSGVITNEFALKWYQMKSALMQRPQAAAFIRFSAELPSGAAERRREHDVSPAGAERPRVTDFTPAESRHTRSELVRFIETIIPHITSTLRGRTIPAVESARRGD
jgi:EpsI family protein